MATAIPGSTTTMGSTTGTVSPGAVSATASAPAYQPGASNPASSTLPTSAFTPQGNPTFWMPNNPNTLNNPAGSISTLQAPPAPQTQAQQAASFYNNYTQPEQTMIANMPIGSVANQVTAPQLGSSPLAGLTALGTPATAGLNTAGLNTAGLYNAGLTTAGLYQGGPVNINTAQSNPLLAAQLQQINNLNATAHGQGPSLAAMQAQAQNEQNIQNTMAMIGSQRGSSNSALGLRNAGNAFANSSQNAAWNAVQGRAQEGMAANQLLQQELAGTQGQVMQGAQAQAGLTQQQILANMAAGNQQQQFNAAGANQQAMQNAQLGNQQQQYNAGQANQLALQNAQFGNQQAQYNASAANQAMMQQGSMNQQTALANQAAQQQTQLANLSSAQQGNLANLQAAQQTQGLNANEYNAMLQSEMALGNTNLTAAENYANLVAQQNAQIQGLNIADKNNVQSLALQQSAQMMGLAGAGIAGGAAMGAGLLTASDVRLKTNIMPATRDMKTFLSQVSRPSSSFSLLSNKL